MSRWTVSLAALVALVLGLAATAAHATPPRASLTNIESDVMCVSCREPLAVAQSPQAYAERNYIRTLIAQGEDKRQIEQSLVGQYGLAVLGKPPADGFNLTVYILPPALLILGLGLLGFTLPRWRRRTRARQAPASTVSALDPAENERLEEELARYDG